MVQLPEQRPEPKEQTLLRDDFIEYILKKTKDETEFRVHEGQWGTIIGFDKDKQEAG